MGGAQGLAPVAKTILHRPAVDLDRAVWAEARTPLNDAHRGIRRDDVCVLLLPQLGDQLVLLPDGRREVGPLSARADAGEHVVLGPVVRLGGADERLRGNAADVDAGAAEHARVDDGRGGAEVGGADGRGEAGRAATDDEQVEALAVPRALWSVGIHRTAADDPVLLGQRRGQGVRADRRLCDHAAAAFFPARRALEHAGDAPQRLVDAARAVVARHAGDFERPFLRLVISSLLTIVPAPGWRGSRACSPPRLAAPAPLWRARTR